MKEQIKEKLLKEYWREEGDYAFVKNTRVPMGKVVINGQEALQYQDISISISYLGEGEMWDTVDESVKVPIYGVKFTIGDNSHDIWIENMKDFDFWYDSFRFNSIQ